MGSPFWYPGWPRNDAGIGSSMLAPELAEGLNWSTLPAPSVTVYSANETGFK